MKVGSNFWFLADWSGESPFTVAHPDFASAWYSGTTDYLVNTNIWSSVFLDEVSMYVLLRFMDWGGTNNSDDVYWSDRKLPESPENYWAWGGEPGGDGMAYEWMIDLCNRTDKNMWVCVPHRADANYFTQLATLIKNRLKPTLKVYVEYSNETWNYGFSQAQYCEDQGVAYGLPGINQWYQAGAYSIWQSLKIFKAFQDVFGSQMSSRVVRVCAFSGNFDIFDQGYNNVVNSSTWNPYGQGADIFACAPYVGSGLDGASSSIQTEFHNAIISTLNDYVIPAKNIANKYGKPLCCYEGGQHLLNNADVWSRNPAIYNEYIYMLSQWNSYFTLFAHYANCGSFSSGGAWGAKEYTGQSLSSAHKFRALKDWISSH